MPAAGAAAAPACGEAARKQWVLDVAREWYLFPELLPASVDLAAYATAEELLDALTATARAQGKDRFFSYLTTHRRGSVAARRRRSSSASASATAPTRATGLSSSTCSRAVRRPKQACNAATKSSPWTRAAASCRCRRRSQTARPFTDLLGPADAGVRRGLRVLRDGATLELSLTKRTVTIDPVPDSFGTRVLPRAGTTGVGYLHLRSYISTADPQLRAAFATFREQDVRDFVIDLRYNGGGLVDTSELINNLLGGDRTSADTQFQYVYRPSKAAQNSTVRFVPQPQSVRPVRIAFLTTEATASASEINVNSMRTWVETAIVGSDTFGKPVGQLAFDLSSSCPDRLRLVAFKTVNADGAGDYYDGLASSMQFACGASDTLGAPMGDPADGLTQAALQWIDTGACASVMTSFVDGQAKTRAASRYPLSQQPRAAERWVPGIH